MRIIARPVSFDCSLPIDVEKNDGFVFESSVIVFCWRSKWKLPCLFLHRLRYTSIQFIWGSVISCG